MSVGTVVLLDSKELSIGVPVSVEGVCRNCYLKRKIDFAGLSEDDIESGKAFSIFEGADLIFNRTTPFIGICVECEEGRPKAILPTILIPIDGTYKIRTFVLGHVPDPEGKHEGWDYELDEELFKGVSLYIGHPLKREFAEKLGAKVVSTEPFPGIKSGECALVLSVKKDKVDELLTRPSGFLSKCGGGPEKLSRNLTLNDIELKVIERLE